MDKPTSWVCEHFLLNNDKTKAECKLCKSVLAYKATSNLANHLRGKYPVTSSASSCKETNGMGKQVQQTTLQFGTKPKSRANWQKITKTLVEMCAMDLRPVSIVNGVSFRKFVAALDPTYIVPSHTTIKNYSMYYCKTLKENLITDLKVQSSLAYTTDTWTSCATEGYLTLTVHFINDAWHLRHYVLSTVEVKDHHTGDHLADVITEICKDFEISYVSVSAITTDNASNMVTMTRKLAWQHIRCFAHTLQLSVKSGLKVKAIAAPIRF